MPVTAQSMKEGATPQEQGSDEHQDLFEAHARNAHRLGFSLLSSFSGNCVLSPQSISVFLAMLAQGASGEVWGKTSEVATNFLKPRTSPPCQTPKLSRGLNGITFEESWASWFEREPRVRTSISDTLQREFRANVWSLDPSHLNESTQAFIQWAAEHSGGIIDHIAAPDTVRSLELIVANTVYFKGYWARQFDRTKTKNRHFHCADGSVVSVPTMVKDKAWLGYTESDDFQAVDLPFAGGQFGLVIILPKITSSVAAVTRRLSQEEPQSLCRSFEAACGDLRLPRFEIQWQGDLNRALKEVAFGDVLISAGSNLLGIADGTATLPTLMLNVCIRTDEDGYEAAAVSGRGLRSAARACKKNPCFKMYVDRPFLFALYHVDMPGPLLVGRTEALSG